MSTSKDVVTLRAAADLVGRAPETVRSWCKKYALGDMDGHRFVIDRERLLAVAKAHAQADAILRELQVAK